MKKELVNRYLRKFGLEVHGTGYLQGVKKQSFKDDPFMRQREIVTAAEPVIFDVGANVGDVTLRYRELFPTAKLYCFEPFPESFAILRQRFEGNPDVHLFEEAVGEVAGVKTFYINHNRDTNSLLKPKKSGLSSDREVANRGVIEVPCTTLDAFVTRHSIGHIDVLKMDIQGGERAALAGAKETLAARKIKCVYCEVYFVEQYEAQPLFHDTATWLYGFGFTLQDIYAPVYGHGNLAWADAMFVLKEAI